MFKRKFNWLDAVCILLVVALILGGVWFFTRREEPKEAEEKGEPYLLTLHCIQNTEDPTNYMKEGDTLYYLNHTDEIGTITSVKLIDRLVEEFDENKGEYIVVKDPAKQIVEVQVEAKGILEKHSFTVNGVKLEVGLVIYPETDVARTSATVWSIEEVA